MPPHSFTLEYGETRIQVKADVDCGGEALDELIKHYTLLVDYINRYPEFKSSYEPVEVLHDAPAVVKTMAAASKECGVGPMAAVAGALAQYVGERILDEGAGEVIADNGGDIYVKTCEVRTIGLYAGDSPFTDRIAFNVTGDDTPCGICTSSGSVGHSVSLGEADSVTAVADSCALADAAATAVANLVADEHSVDSALKASERIKGLRGILIVKGGLMGAVGKLPELTSE